MAGWRKALIISIAMVASVAAIASGSSDSSSGDKKSSDKTATDGSSKSSGTKGEDDEVKEVKINSCAKDDTLGFAEANITVTNGSSKASDYIIEIAFESKDGKTQIGTGTTIVSNLAPGQSKTEDVSSLEDATVEFICKVSKVDRTESL